MKKTLIWIVPYVLSWVAHGTWFLWGPFLAEHSTGIQQNQTLYIVTFAAWFVIVIASRGCPFMYLHQWLAIRAGWRKNITYKFHDCIFYKYILKPSFAGR